MTGYSLHLGVDEPDLAHYGDGRVKPLLGAQADAQAWALFALSRGFEPLLLVGCDATISAVQRWVTTTVREQGLTHVLVTWAGHGARIAMTQTELEDDISEGDTEGTHETWVLWDRMLLDDEVATLLAMFPKSATVIAAVDSCHSGGSLREWMLTNGASDLQDVRTRTVRDDAAAAIYSSHQDMYDAALDAADPDSDIRHIVGLTACRVDEVALESGGRGHFSRVMLELLETRTWESYTALMEATAAELGSGQHPCTYPVDGAAKQFAHEPFEPG